MDIVHMPSFVVHGASTRTSNRDVMHTATARIGALWETFGQTVMPRTNAPTAPILSATVGLSRSASSSP